MNVQFCCNQCDFKTSDATAVKKHRMMFHPQSFKDGQSIYFQPQKTVKIKVETHLCEKCYGEFQTEEELKQHFTNVHTPYAICPQKESESHHENNLNTFHMNKGLVCGDCGFNCLTQNELNIHLEKEHNSILLSCTQCKFKSTRAKSLLQHMKCHEQPNISCNLCSRDFNTHDELVAHKEFHKQKIEKTSISKLKQRQQLDEKMKMQHLKANIFCERCDYKTIIAFISLLKQVKIARFCHKCLKQKKFKCKSCNFISKELSTVREHYRIHRELPVPISYFV